MKYEMNENVETTIGIFVINLNQQRATNGLSPVARNRGYKYSRLIEDHTNGQSENTIAFVDNQTGDIYKPASNVARAQGIRGSIFDSNPFASFTDDCAGIQHFKRGPKPKVNSVESTTETVLEIEVSSDQEVAV